MPPDDSKLNTNPNDRQVGGSHYRKYNPDYQHWDFMADVTQSPAYYIGCITKYVIRWRDKDGLRDLEKAPHYCEKLISLYHNGTLKWSDREASLKRIRGRKNVWSCLDNLLGPTAPNDTANKLNRLAYQVFDTAMSFSCPRDLELLYENLVKLLAEAKNVSPPVS